MSKYTLPYLLRLYGPLLRVLDSFTTDVNYFLFASTSKYSPVVKKFAIKSATYTISLSLPTVISVPSGPYKQNGKVLVGSLIHDAYTTIQICFWSSIQQSKDEICWLQEQIKSWSKFKGVLGIKYIFNI
jgi:hypothetical protein